jgi:hypothetical protein
MIQSVPLLSLHLLKYEGYDFYEERHAPQQCARASDVTLCELML